MAEKSKIHTRKFSEIISIRALARVCDMNHMKIFNNLQGKYNSLTASEKHAISTTIYDSLLPIMDKLGYQIEIKKVKDLPPDRRP